MLFDEFIGSSPRMRGALQIVGSPRMGMRIIPADAGSTTRLSVPAVKIRDHPRGCGEHALTTPWMVAVIGSSPRMRGARLDLPCRRSLSRIIPADAGSTGSGGIP